MAQGARTAVNSGDGWSDSIPASARWVAPRVRTGGLTLRRTFQPCQPTHRYSAVNVRRPRFGQPCPTVTPTARVFGCERGTVKTSVKGEVIEANPPSSSPRLGTREAHLHGFNHVHEWRRWRLAVEEAVDLAQQSHVKS